jgi:hypothetical protein
MTIQALPVEICPLGKAGDFPSGQQRVIDIKKGGSALCKNILVLVPHISF